MDPLGCSIVLSAVSLGPMVSSGDEEQRSFDQSERHRRGITLFGGGNIRTRNKRRRIRFDSSSDDEAFVTALETQSPPEPAVRSSNNREETLNNVPENVLEQYSPSTRAAIHNALTEDLEDYDAETRAAIREALSEDFEDMEEEEEVILPPISLPVNSRPLRRTRVFTAQREARNPRTRVAVRNAFAEHSENDDVETRAAIHEALSEDFEDEEEEEVSLPPVPLATNSRPLRRTRVLNAQREARNRQLLEKANGPRRRPFDDPIRTSERPRLPPLVILDDSDDAVEEAVADRLRRQEEADHQLALKLSAEWNNGSGSLNNPFDRPVAHRSGELPTGEAGPHSATAEELCIICFEKPREAMGCLFCRQLIGCEACILKWRRTTNISNLNRMSPLSRGLSSVNHRCCPLCRVEWANQPEIAPWKDLRKR